MMLPEFNCRTLISPLMIVYILMAMGGEAPAQTLAEFQQQAVANRATVQETRMKLEQSNLDIKIGQSPFWPALDLGYEAHSLNESSAYENDRHSQWNGSLSYNLFSGFRDKYNLEAAEQIQKAREYELQTVIENLKLSVAARYLALFANRQTLIVAEDQLSLLQKRHEDAQHRHSVGLIKRSDVLKLKVEMDNAYLVREKSQADYDKSINLLKHAVGAGVQAQEITFSELKDIPELKAGSHYRDVMFRQRSEIKALEMVIQSRMKTAQAFRSAYYPQINLSLGYRQYGDDYAWGTSTEVEDEARFYTSLDLNLFDGFRKGNTAKRYDLDVRRAQLDLAELKNLLSTTLDNALLDFEVSLENLSVTLNAISQAEENLRVVELSFEEGVETATEVLDAIYFLSRAKMNFIKAKSTVFLNYYQILRNIEGFAAEDSAEQ